MAVRAPTAWQGQERVTLDEAIDAYTRWPAFAAEGEEGLAAALLPEGRGPGVLSRDIFAGSEPMRF